MKTPKKNNHKTKAPATTARKKIAPKHRPLKTKRKPTSRVRQQSFVQKIAGGFLKPAYLVMCLVLTLTAGTAVVMYANKDNTPEEVLADTQVAGRSSQTVVVLKLRDNLGVRLENGVFVVEPGAGGAYHSFLVQGVTALNKVMAESQGAQYSQLFSKNVQQLRKDYQALQAKGKNVADLSMYVQIKVPNSINAPNLVNRLKAVPFVQTAYIQPKIVPAATPSFVSQQYYTASGSYGIGSKAMASWPGVKGEKTQLAIIEFNWNKYHEDLSQLRQTGTFLNGNSIDPNFTTHHSTAVTGILVADDNAYGVTGLVPRAKLYAVSDYANNTTNTANAINIATQKMGPGDVMSISLAATAPDYNPIDDIYLPVEWEQATYDAIKYATAKGITVVEAAGNSGLNLDDTKRFGAPFPQGRPDSGAIIVGAGHPKTCKGKISTKANSRIDFSNYGKRVNVQAWGQCVVTTGYGGLFNGGANARYTTAFNGTSSAAPIVAGAAVALSSAFEKLNGYAPSPAFIRNTLISTGTPQNVAAGMLPGNIGPMPNLTKALLKTDRHAPTSPNGLVVNLDFNNKPILSWNPADDNIDVAKYEIYRDGLVIATTGKDVWMYTDTGATARSTYFYTVRAVDRSGNLSEPSEIVLTTTP